MSATAALPVSADLEPAADSTGPDRFTRRCLGALWVACVIVAAMRGLAPWLADRWARPDDPASVTAVYRPQGDLQLYPFVKDLSELRIGDRVYPGSFSIITVFPVFGLLPHAAGYAIFGALGFPITDALVTVGYLLAFYALMRCAGLPRGWALATAFAMSTNLVDGVLNQLLYRMGLWLPFSLNLVDQRLPRPFVTNLWLTAALATAAAIISSPRAARSGRAWVALGAFLACAVQGDIYSPISGVAIVAMTACVLLARGVLGAPLLARRLAMAGLAAAVVGAVFIYQQLTVPADVAGRLGVFTVPRLHPLWAVWRPQATLFACGSVAALAAAVAWRPAAWVVGQWWLGTAVALFAGLPLMCIALGKTVQPYHFQHVAQFFGALTIVGGASLVCYAAARRVAVARRVAPWVVEVAPVLIILAVAAPRFMPRPPPATHVRAELPAYAPLGDGYRDAFVGLVRWIESQPVAPGRTLACCDHQVNAWWVVFGPGAAALEDACATTASDAAQEQRVASFARLVGMDEPVFRQFLQTPDMQGAWLGHNKYQASIAHTFAPLDEYTAEQRAAIAATTVYDSWHIVVPPREVERLVAIFNAAAPLPADYIILTRFEWARHLGPTDPSFVKAYENRLFTVYRRQPQPAAHSTGTS